MKKNDVDESEVHVATLYPGKNALSNPEQVANHATRVQQEPGEGLVSKARRIMESKMHCNHHATEVTDNTTKNATGTATGWNQVGPKEQPNMKEAVNHHEPLTEAVPPGEHNTEFFPTSVTGEIVEKGKNLLPTLTIGMQRDVTALFFDPWSNCSGGPIRSHLCSAADIMRHQGLSGELLRLSLLIALAMASAYLRYPFALFLCEQSAVIPSILTLVKNLVPKKLIIECAELNRSTLYGADLPGKTIVNLDYAGIRHVRPYLESLIEQGAVSWQEPVLQKSRKGVDAIEIRGSVALISVVHDPGRLDWIGPTTIMVFINPGPDSYIRTTLDDAVYIEARRFTKSLEWLTPHEVSIPFMNFIQDHFLTLKIPAIENIARSLRALISLLTIMHHPEPIYEKDIYAYIYDIKVPRLTNRIFQKEYSLDSMPSSKGKVLSATKVEYYYAYTLCGGRIDINDNGLTARQSNVFEAVKKINFGYLEGSTFTNIRNEIEALNVLPHNSKAWADQASINKQIREEMDGSVSPQTIYKELQVLMDKGLLRSQRFPQNKNKFGYFVLSLDAEAKIAMPHPSTIIDPVYQGNPVKVVNPITGMVEEV